MYFLLKNQWPVGHVFILRIDKGSPCSAVHSGLCSHNCYHYDGILHIFGKAIFFSIHRYVFYSNRLEIIGFMNLRIDKGLGAGLSVHTESHYHYQTFNLINAVDIP